MASHPAGQPQQSSLWKKTRSTGKSSFDWLWRQADEKIGMPTNRLTNKIGSEAFWPSDLKTESEKAARILKSFCKDGYYDEEVTKTEGGPGARQRVVKKIPSEVIANCRGLAIFTAMRTGLWMSGAGGSGIVVARTENGWAGPVGIMLHQAGIGFMAGIDIYDCVLVLNTDEAVAAFSKWRATIGSELSVTAGPVGAGAQLEVYGRHAPIFTYMKSKGFYCGAQIDGSIVIERTDENERFWGQKLPAKDILAGKGQSRQIELAVLYETLKAAEGNTSISQTALPSDPSPSDLNVVEPGHAFGLPSVEDDDPYGVRALEKQGLFVRDAGTKQIVPETEFEFAPKATSPIFRDSGDGSRSTHSSWRESVVTRRESAFSNRRYTTMSDVSTQTDFPLETVSAPPTTAPVQHEFAAPAPDEADEDEWKASSEGASSPTHDAHRPSPPLLPPRGPSNAMSLTSVTRDKIQSPHEAPLPEDAIVNQKTHLEKPVLASSMTAPGNSQREENFEHGSAKSVSSTLTRSNSDGASGATGPDVSQTDTQVSESLARHSVTSDDGLDMAQLPAGNQRLSPAPPSETSHTREEGDSQQSQQVPRPQVITKASAARIVTVAKRVPPKLPERNPGRSRGRVSGSVTPNSIHDLSPSRERAAIGIDGGAPTESARRGSETSEEKGSSSLVSISASESTEDDKQESLKPQSTLRTASSPPAIPERSRSRDHTPRAADLKATGTFDAAHSPTTTTTTKTAPIAPVLESQANRSLVKAGEDGNKGRNDNDGNDGNDENDDNWGEEEDDEYLDDISDAEIVTATTQQRKPQPGPRISMAQIRDSLHNDRSPSPRGRAASRDFTEDFS